MGDAKYYVKKVRRNDEGNIVRFKISKGLGDKPKKELKWKKVAKHVKKGKDVRTAYLKDGTWTEGDSLELTDGGQLRTTGNKEEGDNLSNLRSF